ncbi:hypothetical protein BS47DRAFT_1340538 [Hydnum rufescens UP504]|uniref:Uncharacterized protein n=1 Tax=Hydnum rufescens UP504 TaxID=1448309 RepID=A0A9P6DZF0_9AGAM|nr:hypothetical protein BS47DRAFT_1340538 [Hydnum rufescens UP504]
MAPSAVARASESGLVARNDISARCGAPSIGLLLALFSLTCSILVQAARTISFQSLSSLRPLSWSKLHFSVSCFVVCLGSAY